MSMRQEAAGAASREAEGRRLSGLEAVLHIDRASTQNVGTRPSYFTA